MTTSAAVAPAALFNGRQCHTRRSLDSLIGLAGGDGRADWPPLERQQWFVGGVGGGPRGVTDVMVMKLELGEECGGEVIWGLSPAGPGEAIDPSSVVVMMSSLLDRY